jgi:hypothetical protein
VLVLKSANFKDNIMMNFFDENETGTPKDKYYETIPVINAGVYEEVLGNELDRMIAMEVLLENDEDLEKKIRSIVYGELDKMEELRQNKYMELMAQMMTRHE